MDSQTDGVERTAFGQLEAWLDALPPLMHVLVGVYVALGLIAIVFGISELVTLATEDPPRFLLVHLPLTLGVALVVVGFGVRDSSVVLGAALFMMVWMAGYTVVDQLLDAHGPVYELFQYVFGKATAGPR